MIYKAKKETLKGGDQKQGIGPKTLAKDTTTKEEQTLSKGHPNQIEIGASKYDWRQQIKY